MTRQLAALLATVVPSVALVQWAAAHHWPWCAWLLGGLVCLGVSMAARELLVIRRPKA